MEPEPGTCARHPSKAINAEAVERVGQRRFMKYSTQYTKKIWDYPKRKDCFMGRENRRYWLVDLKTGKKKRITEKQFHGDWANVS